MKIGRQDRQFLQSRSHCRSPEDPRSSQHPTKSRHWEVLDLEVVLALVDQPVYISR